MKRNPRYRYQTGGSILSNPETLRDLQQYNRKDAGDLRTNFGIPDSRTIQLQVEASRVAAEKKKREEERRKLFEEEKARQKELEKKRPLKPPPDNVNRGDIATHFNLPTSEQRILDIEAREGEKQRLYHNLRRLGVDEKRAKSVAIGNLKMLKSEKERLEELENVDYRVSKHPDYDPNVPIEDQQYLNLDNSLVTRFNRGRNMFIDTGNPVTDFVADAITYPGKAFVNLTMDADKQYFEPGLATGLTNLGGDLMTLFPSGANQVAGKILQKVPVRKLVNQAYKINPWAKGNVFNKWDADKYYRIVNEAGFDDAMQSRVIRSNVAGDSKVAMMEGINLTRPTAFPAFAKGSPHLDYLPANGKGYIIESDIPMFSRGELNPVTGSTIKGRHWAYRPINTTTGDVMQSIPIENVNVYGPHWLNGYTLKTRQMGGAVENGGISTQGYKSNSPDRFNAYNIIPSNNITMKNVPHPVFGIDNTGARQMMYPGANYRFPGQAVFEIPVRHPRYMQVGGEMLQIMTPEEMAYAAAVVPPGAEMIPPGAEMISPGAEIIPQVAEEPVAVPVALPPIETPPSKTPVVKKRKFVKDGREKWNEYLDLAVDTDGDAKLKDILYKVSRDTGVRPEILFASAMEEGLQTRRNGKKLVFDKDKEGKYVDGFRTLGLDTFGDRVDEFGKKGYLKKQFDYYPSEETNELGTKVNSAYFDTLEDGLYAKAAYLLNQIDVTKAFAKKNKLKLSDDAVNFFAMQSYNGGDGILDKAYEKYKKQGLLAGEKFLDQEPVGGYSSNPSYYNTRKRYDSAKYLLDIGAFNDYYKKRNGGETLRYYQIGGEEQQDVTGFVGEGNINPYYANPYFRELGPTQNLPLAGTLPRSGFLRTMQASPVPLIPGPGKAALTNTLSSNIKINPNPLWLQQAQAGWKADMEEAKKKMEADAAKKKAEEDKNKITTKTVWGPNVPAAQGVVAGLSFLGNALESKDRNRYLDWQRLRGMGDGTGAVMPGSRGDYTTNEGYFRPDQYTPVQFGAVPAFQSGGYFSAPMQAAAIAYPTEVLRSLNIPAFMPSSAPVDPSYKRPVTDASPVEFSTKEAVDFRPAGKDIATKTNNPGNMKYNKWMSKYGGYNSGIEGKDGGSFAAFPTVQAGLQAYQMQLFGDVDGVFKSQYYKADTPVDKALRTWSGKGGYGEDIYPKIKGKRLGDLSQEERYELMKRQIRHESGSMYGLLTKAGVFRAGGEYNVTHEQLQQILAHGGEVEFL